MKITNTTTNEVANLYTSGGVSAYGVGTSSSSGGGLNGSVKAYADAVKLTTENLSEVASAYSVAKLYSEIQNVASAVPSISVSVPTGGNALSGATYDASTGVITFTKGTFLTAHQSLDGYVNAIAVSGSGNAVTAISKSGTTISVTKGITFLTSHQSLDGYVNEVATSGTGNAITSVSKSGKKLTFTKGATFLTSHQSLSAYLKSADAANTYLKRSGGTMTGVLVLDTPIGGMTQPNTMRLFLNTSKYDGLTSTPGIGFHIFNVCWGNLRMESDTSLTWFTSDNEGYLPIKASGFIIGGVNSNDYVLLGGGGHKAISSLSVSYASSAGSANSVAWGNVSGRPTKLSQFTNDKNFVTGSVSGNTITINGVSTTWQNTWRGITDSFTNLNSTISLSQKGGNDLYQALVNGYASSAGNADTCDGLHVHSGRNNEANKIVRTDQNGYIFCGYINCSVGNEGNNSSPARVWGTNGSDDYLRTYMTSALEVNRALRVIGTLCRGDADQHNKGLWSTIKTNDSGYFGRMSVYEIYNDGGPENYGNVIEIVSNYVNHWQPQIWLGGGDGAIYYRNKNYNASNFNSWNQVAMMNYTNNGNFLATGGITAYSSSDIRLKQDLRKLDYLGIIKAMGGTFGFAWKKDNTRSIGWIAQHVLQNPHLKDIVETDEKGYYKINYWSPKLIATAFGAIEQVGDEVSRLKARVVFLESEVQRLSGKQDGNNKKRLDNKNINLLN